jgi:hypothetical protein
MKTLLAAFAATAALSAAFSAGAGVIIQRKAVTVNSAATLRRRQARGA